MKSAQPGLKLFGSNAPIERRYRVASDTESKPTLTLNLSNL